MSVEEYVKYRAAEAKRKKEAQEKKPKIPFFWSSFKLRNSVLFSDSIAASVRNAKTTYAEASTLLGVPISTLERFLRREKTA